MDIMSCEGRNKIRKERWIEIPETVPQNSSLQKMKVSSVLVSDQFNPWQRVSRQMRGQEGQFPNGNTNCQYCHCFTFQERITEM